MKQPTAVQFGEDVDARQLWPDIKFREVTNANRDVHMSLEEERRIAKAEAAEVLKSLQPPPMVLEHPQGETE